MFIYILLVLAVRLAGGLNMTNDVIVHIKNKSTFYLHNCTMIEKFDGPVNIWCPQALNDMQDVNLQMKVTLLGVLLGVIPTLIIIFFGLLVWSNPRLIGVYLRRNQKPQEVVDQNELQVLNGDYPKRCPPTPQFIIPQIIVHPPSESSEESRALNDTY